MNLIRLLIGGLLLLLGRKLFWLFVAAVGFAAGWAVATNLLHVQPDWVALVLAGVVGVAGALLAHFVSRLAIGLAGFLAGGFLALSLVALLHLQPDWWGWVGFVVGGILGAVLLGAALDWALIGLSSLAGAVLVANALNLPSTVHLLVLVGLFIVGVILQAAMGGRGHKKD
jgi:Domain of unknown function (DUF4203)